MDGPGATPAAGGTLFRQLRPLLLFCGAALLALAVVVSFAARGLMASFASVERDATRQKAEQVYRAFEADLRQLAISTRDYAEWDDAEAFVRAPDPDFLTRNFSAETLTQMHVDLMWIVDADGNDIYSTLADRASKTSATPAPAELLAQLRPFETRDRSMRERSPAERTLATSFGLVAASAIEIARSDTSNPTGAVLLFARFIEDAEIERVRETSQLPVAMHYLDSASDSSGLPAPVRSWLAGGAADGTFVRVLDRAQIAGYSVVRDLQGKTVAVFATDTPRDIFTLGARATWFFVGSVVALLIAFGATAIGLVLRMLKLQRLDFDHRRHAEEQQRENKRSLEKQAQQDALTGLPNRMYVNARLPSLLRTMADSQRLLALVHLDIDHFKNLNDSRGHGSGDQLLQVVAKRLRASVSTHDVVARMGGDEFVIVASLLPDAEAIDRFAARLLAAVGADMLIDGEAVRVTASLGIAVYPRDGVDTESLLKRADIALHQAKESGRSCHRFFTEDMDTRIREQVTLEQSLRRAIGTPEIFLEYQPIVALTDGHVVSLEALMRWRHPEMGLIPPARFIPVAEKSDLIIEIGQQALRGVLLQQREWLDADVPVVPIAVNVSPLQIERLDFAAQVRQLASEIGVDPKWLRFEVTESAMMRQPDKLVGTLRSLRELGSKVLIDDFGTGYSSLSYLDRLPIDIVKIDRAFVRDLTRSFNGSPIVDAVIDIAKRKRLETVAEGVETEEQAAGLRDRGCDYAQGFFYSKPVSAEHCRSMLEHLRREKPLTETMVMRVLGSR
jgi:diguanylate cyclase (GGDEF)-like protein